MSSPKRASFQSIFKDDASKANTEVREETETKGKASKMTCFRLNPMARKQLAMLGVEEGESLQSLMHQAVNDLFEKYNKPRIA